MGINQVVELFIIIFIICRLNAKISTADHGTDHSVNRRDSKDQAYD